MNYTDMKKDIKTYKELRSKIANLPCELLGGSNKAVILTALITEKIEEKEELIQENENIV